MKERRPEHDSFNYEKALHSFRDYGFSREEAEALLGTGSEEDKQDRYRVFQEIVSAFSDSSHVGTESIRLMFHGWNDTLITDAGFAWDRSSEGFRHQDTGEVVPRTEIFNRIPPFIERWQQPDGPGVVKEGLLQGIGVGEPLPGTEWPERTMQDELDEITQAIEAGSDSV